MKKKTNTPSTTVTRDLEKFSEPTGNLYESVVIMSKRANQISADMKSALEQKLQEFSTYTDTLEEYTENQEQIEISKYYEQQPKSTLVATTEFLNGDVYFRLPNEESQD